MVMTGGGSLLRNMDRFLAKETGVPAYLADQPMACVALGAGKALENYHLLKKSLPEL
jgi:rod shape-determining protein MreB